MLVYRDNSRWIDAGARLRNPGRGRDALIEFGEIEAGVADALCTEVDDIPPVVCDMREAAVNLAAGRVTDFSLPVPARVRVSVPEGFAWYALYPEMYETAARRYARERRPVRVAVIGIRSIGTTLSAVVTAALGSCGCAVRSYTVRPRGHPFERRLAISDRLASEWREWRDAEFAIVDEGPGMSGSSFASVANALSELGIDDGHIVLFPGWDADGSTFVSASARDRWRRHQRFTSTFEELFPGFGGMRDLSAGAWREVVYGDGAVRPAVQPQHERRKYLDGTVLHKFAGLGRYGREQLARAERLAEGGFTPEPLSLDDGFLSAPFVEGHPVRDITEPLLSHIAEYLKFVARSFPAPQQVGRPELMHMVEVNVTEALGDKGKNRLGKLSQPPKEQAVAGDNRMLAHEWLVTSRGFVKTDALEHHNDHFYPGPQPAQWDVAAASVEFNLDQSARTYLASCAGVSVVDFYAVAYLAFRCGYTDMAARALGDTPDAARFRAEFHRYARMLQSELERL